MKIINEMILWYKGEAFESILMGCGGFMLILFSALCWFLGKTPNAQALIIPLFLVGLLLGGAGISGFYSNNKIAMQLLEMEVEDEELLLASEKQRVENFQSLYTYTKIGAAIAFGIAISIFFISDRKHVQAFALALIIIGLSGLIIDYFSKERVDNYYGTILELIG